MTSKPITTSEIRARKARGERLVMCTAYDATFASILDTAGTDILLVGDSLGMVVQGHETTIPVTLDHMIYHTRAVTRGTKRAHVVGDMPFMSYKVSAEQALESAMRLMQEGRAHSVKLEGGQELAPTITRITEAGIPVMGHIGLTPQSVHAMGGFKIQGRSSEGAERILNDALALQDAGCFAIVLEGIPLDLAKEITSQLEIPTIGIGAGVHCDGQVLVCYDMLGMNEGFKPKFLKEYANLHEVIVGAVQNYADEVRAGTFPDESHSFKSKKLRLVEGEESKLYSTTA
jgi:3-methyl-2-oxobutanoate hydroxymethyltransferase